MAKRLAPLRNLDPHDVINGYAMDDIYVNENLTGVGFSDNGVFVTIVGGNLDLDPMTYGTDNYLGNTSNIPFLGFNQYPKVTQKIRPAASGDVTIGLTLMETAKYDENGEKLLYYKAKADENQIVLLGQAVPVASRGIFTLFKNAIDGTLTPGSGFKLSTTSGKITGCANTDTAKIGLVMGTGSRGANGAGIPDLYSGTFAMIKLN